MRTEKEGSCVNIEDIQAFIDGELGENQLRVEQHINSCQVCLKRVEEQRENIVQVFDTLDLFDRSTQLTKRDKSSENRLRQTYRIKWLSAVASVVILVGLLSVILFHNPKEDVLVDQNCEWVEMNDPDFNPNFESPNRLYQMRIIYALEIDNNDSLKNKYFVKKCYQ
jgi:hypothetical protein